jgi:hypothetical protein
MTDARQCDCESPPFLRMERIPAASASRFYLCRRCGTVRVEEAIQDIPGTVGKITFHALSDPSLPASVRERALEILDNRDRKQERLL